MQEIINKNKKVLLIDVRSVQEFKEGHLRGAINIPLYELEKHLEDLKDKEQVIIVYCARGYRSKQAKEKLEKLGYKNVYSLKGGLEEMLN